MNWIDSLGLWSPGAHDIILQRSFENRLSQNEINLLQQASRDFDSRTQAANQSYMHSMRLKSQTAEEAIRLRDQFVTSTLDDAKRLARSGNKNAALVRFGEACHPIMDSSSPVHVDVFGNPRIWNPWWPFGHSPNDYIGNETIHDLTPAILEQQILLLNNAYKGVFEP